MKNIIKIIKKYNSFALFSHENPDPDTIGSTLALKRILEKLGKTVHLYCESEIPQDFYFLDGAKNYEQELSCVDCMISVDVAGVNMLGKYKEQFLNFNRTLRIDHHVSGGGFAKYNWCENYSACAILIYELAKRLKVWIDAEIATNLYFGICGDTGLFKNNNTDAYTFEVCSNLLKSGARIRTVYAEFFDKKTVSYVKMSSHCLESATTNDRLGYAVLQATKEDFINYGLDSTNDSLGNLANVYLSCGYNIAVILKEKADGIHCSLRSKFDFDVSKIANVFGGGGHRNASGCLINEPLKTATRKMQTEIENYLKSLYN